MRKSEIIWSAVSFVNLTLVLSFALTAHQCRESMREAQNAVPPPPPGDYVGALVLMILTGASALFGLLFLISAIITLGFFVKNRSAASREK